MHMIGRFSSPFFAVLLAFGCSSSSSNGTTTSPATAFVGTWSRAGTVTTTCPGQAPSDAAFTGTLTITAGADANSIVGTESVHGCSTTYLVSGSVATAAAAQKCTFTNPKGGQSTSTNTSHTLTLSADGKTLSEASTGNVVVGEADGGAGVTCTVTSSGAFTKQ
jgi:hypothetical protein